MTPPGRVVKAVAKYVAAHPGCSRQDVRVATRASDVAIDKAIDHYLIREKHSPMCMNCTLWPLEPEDGEIDLHCLGTANF